VVDYFASPQEVEKEYNIKLSEMPDGKYDAIIVAVNHEKYTTLSDDFFKEFGEENLILVDLKGIYRNKSGLKNYMSL